MANRRYPEQPPEESYGYNPGIYGQGEVVRAPAPTPRQNVPNLLSMEATGPRMQEGTRPRFPQVPSPFDRDQAPPTPRGGPSTATPVRGPAPTLGRYPEFRAPRWDEGEITSLTQERAAPGVRRLREAVQRATTQPYENPAVKSMSLREALAGYGTGLESVMGGAARTARGEYGEEYGRKFQAEQIQHATEIQRVQTSYEAAWQDWLRGGGGGERMVAGRGGG